MKYFAIAFLIFPAFGESLHYTINWPSGLSLGEATLRSDHISDKAGGEKTNSHWDSALDIDASVPGFVIRDHYESTAGNDLCSTRFEKKYTHGKHSTEERISFDQDQHTASRETVRAEEKTTFRISSCARDALTFIQFARKELAQGRLAPQQPCCWAPPMTCVSNITGTMTINVGDKKTEADRSSPRSEARQSNLTVEIFFARDAARTPLLAKVAARSGNLFGRAATLEMRIAFFSPLPPAKSGIADYSAAVLDPLRRLAEVDTFTEKPAHFDFSRYDVGVYQLGNNPHHTFAYEMAIRHPGVVVMHEANLHHLIADLTIRRGDWDAYLREVESNAGAEALAFARRYVRTLERGPGLRHPDAPFDSFQIARRHRSQRCSRRGSARRTVSPAQSPEFRTAPGSSMATACSYRSRLGLDERAPLVGIFGFLKPYKRIAESLRAFRRLVRVAPDARMILAGEAHPELPLAIDDPSMGFRRTFGISDLRQSRISTAT